MVLIRSYAVENREPVCSVLKIMDSIESGSPSKNDDCKSVRVNCPVKRILPNSRKNREELFCNN
jgi:hypothetical protein